MHLSASAAELARLFLDDLIRADEVTLEPVRRRSRWARVTEWAAGLVAPLL